MNQMRYLLAFDGGGTKTDSVLFDETGHIYKRIVGKGGNATDLGKEEAISRFIDCLDQVISGFTKPISSVYGGMAGVIPNGDFYTKYVSVRFPTSTIRFEDDGCNIISGGIGHQDGCGMVCGTGSSLFNTTSSKLLSVTVISAISYSFLCKGSGSLAGDGPLQILKKPKKFLSFC